MRLFPMEIMEVLEPGISQLSFSLGSIQFHMGPLFGGSPRFPRTDCRTGGRSGPITHVTHVTYLDWKNESCGLLRPRNSYSGLHPGRLTWNLQITHLETKMIFQTSMIMFQPLIFRGVFLLSRLTCEMIHSTTRWCSKSQSKKNCVKMGNVLDHIGQHFCWNHETVNH